MAWPLRATSKKNKIECSNLLFFGLVSTMCDDAADWYQYTKNEADLV